MNLNKLFINHCKKNNLDINPNQLDKEIFDKINIIKLKIETSIDNYRFRKAMSLVIDLSRLGNKYLADTEPWKIIKEDKDRVKSILYNSIQLILYLHFCLIPLINHVRLYKEHTKKTKYLKNKNSLYQKSLNN